MNPFSVRSDTGDDDPLIIASERAIRSSEGRTRVRAFVAFRQFYYVSIIAIRRRCIQLRIYLRYVSVCVRGNRRRDRVTAFRLKRISSPRFSPFLRLSWLASCL